MGVVQLIPDDDPESLVSPLGSQPGRHAGVDDHPDILGVLRVQAQPLLHGIVGSAVGVFGPDCGVEDDLDPAVHHGGSLYGVTAASVELLDEQLLLGDVRVVLPLAALGVPVPAVDGEAVDERVWAIVTEERQSLVVLQRIKILVFRTRLQTTVVTSWSCFDSALNISLLILAGVQVLKPSAGGMEGTTMKGSLSRPILDHRAYMIPAIRTRSK